MMLFNLCPQFVNNQSFEYHFPVNCKSFSPTHSCERVIEQFHGLSSIEVAYTRAYMMKDNKKGLEANRLKTLELSGGASLIRTGDLRIMIPSL